MTEDTLETLLRESAPPTPAPESVPRDTYARMIADARRAARPVRRRRLVMAGVGAGLAVALAGGGLAVAGGVLRTSATAQDDGRASFAYRLPSGRACEVRVSIYGADPVVQDAARWLQHADVEGQLDLAGAEQWDRDQAKWDPHQTSVLDPDRGMLMDVQMAPRERTPDDIAAIVVVRAAAMVAVDHLAANKVAIPTGHSSWQFGNGESGVTSFIVCTVDHK